MKKKIDNNKINQELIKNLEKGKGFIEEFKEFAIKGNVIDMSVGVVIGTAFGKIATSLVNDIIMPLMSFITGNIDFTDLKFTKQYVKNGKTLEMILPYGNFIQTIINFIIIAFSIFIVVKMLNKLNKNKENILDEQNQKKEQAETLEKQELKKILLDITDILKENNK